MAKKRPSISEALQRLGESWERPSRQERVSRPKSAAQKRVSELLWWVPDRTEIPSVDKSIPAIVASFAAGAPHGERSFPRDFLADTNWSGTPDPIHGGWITNRLEDILTETQRIKSERRSSRIPLLHSDSGISVSNYVHAYYSEYEHWFDDADFDFWDWFGEWYDSQ